MRRHRTKTWLGWLLGAACIALAWVIYEEIADLSAGQPIDSTGAVLPSALAATSSQPALIIPDRASLAVILERPVFSETRRPRGTATGGAQATPIDFTLLGVVISDSQRSALIRTGEGEAVQRLTEGEDIADWKLVQIAPDRIVVRRGTVEADVFLDYSTPAPPVPRTQIPKVKPTAEAAHQEPTESTAGQPTDAAMEPDEGTQNGAGTR
jgi:hypothetical protein